MLIENRIHVDAPLHRTWPVLNDIPRVATCIPHAEIVEIVDERTYRAKVSLKIGPLALSYHATVVVEKIDQATHSATFHIHGHELTGRGGVRAKVSTRAEADGHRTRIVLQTHAHVSGVVAKLGGPLIEGVAKKIAVQFAKRLAAIA
ncbi:MAG: SRPBCC family protein [Candidatus Baltobacteraceae bacterium]